VEWRGFCQDPARRLVAVAPAAWQSNKQLLKKNPAFFAALADRIDQEVTLQNLNILLGNAGQAEDGSSGAQAPDGIFSSERGAAAVLDPAAGPNRAFGVLLSAEICCTDPGWYHGCEVMVQRKQPVWLTMRATKIVLVLEELRTLLSHS